MAERNILGYFHSRDEAESVVSKLQSLSLIDYSIDEVGMYPGDGADRIMNPINSGFPGLGYLTLNGDFPNIGAGILSAMDPDASGMSDVSNGGIMSGRNILLTAVIEESDLSKAVDLIQSAGGIV